MSASERIEQAIQAVAEASNSKKASAIIKTKTKLLRLYFEADCFDEAVSIGFELFSAGCNAAVVFLLTGKAAFNLERFSEAEQCYRRFLMAEPDKPQGWLGLFEVHEHTEQSLATYLDDIKNLKRLIPAGVPQLNRALTSFANIVANNPTASVDQTIISIREAGGTMPIVGAVDDIRTTLSTPVTDADLAMTDLWEALYKKMFLEAKEWQKREVKSVVMQKTAIEAKRKDKKAKKNADIPTQVTIRILHRLCSFEFQSKDEPYTSPKGKLQTSDPPAHPVAMFDVIAHLMRLDPGRFSPIWDLAMLRATRHALMSGTPASVAVMREMASLSRSPQAALITRAFPDPTFPYLEVTPMDTKEEVTMVHPCGLAVLLDADHTTPVPLRVIANQPPLQWMDMVNIGFIPTPKPICFVTPRICLEYALANVINDVNDTDGNLRPTSLTYEFVDVTLTAVTSIYSFDLSIYPSAPLPLMLPHLPLQFTLHGLTDTVAPYTMTDVLRAYWLVVFRSFPSAVMLLNGLAEDSAIASLLRAREVMLNPACSATHRLDVLQASYAALPPSSSSAGASSVRSGLASTLLAVCESDLYTTAGPTPVTAYHPSGAPDSTHRVMSALHHATQSGRPDLIGRALTTAALASVDTFTARQYLAEALKTSGNSSAAPDVIAVAAALEVDIGMTPDTILHIIGQIAPTTPVFTTLVFARLAAAKFPIPDVADVLVHRTPDSPVTAYYKAMAGWGSAAPAISAPQISLAPGAMMLLATGHWAKGRAESALAAASAVLEQIEAVRTNARFARIHSGLHPPIDIDELSYKARCLQAKCLACLMKYTEAVEVAMTLQNDDAAPIWIVLGTQMMASDDVGDIVDTLGPVVNDDEISPWVRAEAALIYAVGCKHSGKMDELVRVVAGLVHELQDLWHRDPSVFFTANADIVLAQLHLELALARVDPVLHARAASAILTPHQGTKVDPAVSITFGLAETILTAHGVVPSTDAGHTRAVLEACYESPNPVHGAAARMLSSVNGDPDQRLAALAVSQASPVPRVGVVLHASMTLPRDDEGIRGVGVHLVDAARSTSLRGLHRLALPHLDTLDDRVESALRAYPTLTPVDPFTPVAISALADSGHWASVAALVPAGPAGRGVRALAALHGGDGQTIVNEIGDDFTEPAEILMVAAGHGMIGQTKAAAGALKALKPAVNVDHVAGLLAARAGNVKSAIKHLGRAAAHRHRRAGVALAAVLLKTFVESGKEKQQLLDGAKEQVSEILARDAVHRHGLMLAAAIDVLDGGLVDSKRLWHVAPGGSTAEGALGVASGGMLTEPVLHAIRRGVADGIVTCDLTGLDLDPAESLRLMQMQMMHRPEVYGPEHVGKVAEMARVLGDER